MGKMKELFIEQMNQVDSKFIDDTYRYQLWQENKIKFGDPPLVSDCCEAPINTIKGRSVCTNCHCFCKSF